MYRIIGADQKEYGPITLDQIRRWIAEGRINAQTKVQPEGAAEWKTLAEVPELAVLLPIRPPLPAPIIMTPAAAAPANNTLAVWSLVTGIASFVCCCGILGPIAIVLGIIALSQIKENPNQGGKGMAIAGLVLGCIHLLFTIIGVLIMILSPNLLQNLQNALPQ